jgi:hypothetical protein
LRQRSIKCTEAQNLLGCTVFLIECQQTFQRYVLPPSSPIIRSMMEAARTSETSVDIQLRIQYIPEDSELHTRRHENLWSHISNVKN